MTSVPTGLIAGGAYMLAGKQLNGLSEAASYGDDVQGATNYPMVKIVNNVTGHATFARTYNHSDRSIAPNSKGSTEFALPEVMEPGASKLYVVTNGIPSAPVNITVQNGLYAAAPDFNHDGKADILWRDRLAYQYLGDEQWRHPQNAEPHRVEPTVDDCGDWRFQWRRLHRHSLARQPDRRGGDIGALNNGVMVSTAGGQKVAQDWSVIGTGDFNGDRKSDILWRNSRTGAVTVWLMNGGNILASGSSYAVGLDWTAAGLGDFNGDRKTDILWRNSAAGAVATWTMNGVNIAETTQRAANAIWTIVGTGDFNGDGFSDILWQRQQRHHRRMADEGGQSHVERRCAGGG